MHVFCVCKSACVHHRWTAQMCRTGHKVMYYMAAIHAHPYVHTKRCRGRPQWQRGSHDMDTGKQKKKQRGLSNRSTNSLRVHFWQPKKFIYVQSRWIWAKHWQNRADKKYIRTRIKDMSPRRLTIGYDILFCCGSAKNKVDRAKYASVPADNLY